MKSLVIIFGVFLTQMSFAQNMGDEEIHHLTEKYAPLVKFHEAEEYFPSSVDWYLNRSQLNKKIHDQVTLVLDGPKSIDLMKYSDESYFLTARGSDLERDLTFRGEPIENGFSPAPCYVSLVEKKDSKEIVIQYLFFYPYNGRIWGLFDSFMSWTGINIGAHEGDWEHLKVFLSLDQSNQYQVNRLFYAEHQESFGHYFEPSQITFENETHPIVYSAYHGHASYAHETYFMSTYGDRTSENGNQWQCWKKLIRVKSGDQSITGQEWMRFRGLWGADHSPQTPSFQNWWEFE